MQQHGSKYFTHRAPPRTLGGSNVNSTFSEHVYVAYQIKRKVECSSMKANILSFHTPSTQR